MINGGHVSLSETTERHELERSLQAHFRLGEVIMLKLGDVCHMDALKSSQAQARMKRQQRFLCAKIHIWRGMARLAYDYYEDGLSSYTLILTLTLTDAYTVRWVTSVRLLQARICCLDRDFCEAGLCSPQAL